MLVNWKKILNRETHIQSRIPTIIFSNALGIEKGIQCPTRKEKVSHKKHPLSYAYVAGIHNRKIMHGINFFLPS